MSAQPNPRSGFGGDASARGELVARFIPRNGFYEHGLPRDIKLRYRLRSYWMEAKLRMRLAPKGFWRGLLGKTMVGVGRLHATLLRADGSIVHLGLISTRVVTDAGVNYIRDDWNGGGNIIDNFNYHGSGTGTTAEAAGDTALVTESTTDLNPDSTRATGTKSVPGTGQMRTVGTLTYDNTVAVTEHGIFSQSATGGGTLLDRSKFTAINVVSGDSIQFTYTFTINSGG